MPKNPPKYEKPGQKIPPSQLEEYIDQDVSGEDAVPGVRAGKKAAVPPPAQPEQEIKTD